MSSVLRPRGPQKAAVYWRRRALVLVLVLALLLALGLLLFGGGGDSQTQAGAAPQEEPAAAPDDQGPSPQPSQSAAASPTPSGASPSARPAVPACPDSGIEVSVATDRQTYAAGENPQITMTITNTTDSDCLRDIGSGVNTVKISSGGFDAWSSDDCDPSQAGNEQVLPAGGKAQASVTWERKLSAAGCAGDAAPAQPGVYQVTASNGDVVSEPVRITLQ